jgi:hypothetical protein
VILTKQFLAIDLLLVLLILPYSTHAVVFISEEINTTPTPENFSVCFDLSCKSIAQLSLNQNQWQSIRQLFLPRANTAVKEREHIGRAIARMEQLVGKMTNTSHDKGENESTDDPRDHQMDCIDESTNTTNYIYMMQEAGLLQWHHIKEPVTRGFFFFGWPHTTAVIEEKASATNWAIDSWFHDNGIKPEIIPLPQWKSGWHPETK